MSIPDDGKVAVVEPDQGASFWQPVPANGYAELRISHRRQPAITALAAGIQIVAPGCHIREHIHPASEELIFVIEGHGEAVIDGVRHAMPTGTTVYIGAGHRHLFKNTGVAELKLHWVMVPGGADGLDDFFARIGRARTPGEPAPEPFPRPADVAAIEAGTVFRPPG